jgi:serine/threonine-protein kinase
LNAEHTIQVANRTWRIQIESTPPDLGGTPLLAGGISLSLLLGLTTAGAFALRELRRRMREALHLGQYTLTEKIGEGGMGVVYRARHALLSRPTAIKLLPPERGEARVQRFEREAQLTSELTHPNTIVVYDYGRTSDGTLYYVMEYLDGVTFEELVQKYGGQPPGRVVHLLLQVCGALGEAHSVGLIHRDIKPANLMLTHRGGVADFVKVLDFGLVKRRSTPDDVSLSSTHALLGTPGYWSPESIVSPDQVDARSDIYSLGAVAYYLLTGATVFAGQTVVELVSQHLHSTPVPPSARSIPPVPPSLDAVVMKCLGKSPDARYQSATDLERALLACNDVRPWTRAEAEAWWQEHAPRQGEARKPDVPSTVIVDLERRRAARV